MGPVVTWLLFTVAVALCGVGAQENAGMTIPTSLLECYSNQTILAKEGLPTFSIGQLIDIVRKVENWPYTRLDLKNMAVQLTHRFRQDGIRRNPTTLPSEGVIPFTPSGPEFFRHQILLMKLIPGNAYNFPNNSLTMAEQCALHFMLSTTVDDIQRRTDDSECSNLKNYETDSYYGGSSSSGSSYQGPSGWGGGYSSGVNYDPRRGGFQGRGPRRTRTARKARAAGIETDVEILDPSLQAEVDKTRASMSNYPHSRCPIQGGVVFTPWGSVSGGTVLAGIAAGLVPQSVPGEMLAAAFPRSKYYTQQRGRHPGLSADTLGSIDNKWAATFSGDLAQVALLQGAQSRDRMAVGLAGGWNSTQEPHHYFLTQLSEGAMSDANIRGCIDGMVMGYYVNDWYSRTSSALKLSQLLDMYFSERGVFSRDNRACKRKDRFPDVATQQTLSAQTEAFSKFYGRNNPISVTMSDDVISDLADIAVTKLQSYIQSSLNDPPCTVGTSDLLVRPYVDMIIVLDTSWDYSYLHPAMAFLLDKMEAGPYGSNAMILSGKDGDLLFNSTYPRLDWHTTYTRDEHTSIQTSGQGQGITAQVALGAVMQQLRKHDYQFSERRVPAGRGQVVLFFTSTQGLGSYDQYRLYDRMINFRQLYPDVEVLVMTQGNKNAFSSISNDTTKDIFTIAPTDPATSILPLIDRLKNVPRRIRNPNCNPDWVETRTGNSDFVDYVEPMGVNYYRIAPNNFYRVTDQYAKVRVQGQGYGTLTVCYSRALPAMNGTKSSLASQASSAGTCVQLSNNGVEIPMYNLCPDASLVKDCAPLFLAVSASQSAQGATARCTDDQCRFPDMIKYTVSLEKLGCWSGACGLRSAGLAATVLLSVSLRWLLGP